MVLLCSLLLCLSCFCRPAPGRFLQFGFPEPARAGSKARNGCRFGSASSANSMPQRYNCEGASRFHGKRSSHGTRNANKSHLADKQSNDTHCSQVKSPLRLEQQIPNVQQLRNQTRHLGRRLSCFTRLLRPSQHVVPEAPLVQQTDWLQVNVQPEKEMLIEASPRPTCYI